MEYVPLVHSKGVVDALLAGTVDYGVMATPNHAAGVVLETEAALREINYKMLALDCIPIHRCLFVQNSSVTKIRAVATHIQALKQYTDYAVYGWKRTRSVAETALAEGAADGIADDEILAQCDLPIPVLYPEATIQFPEQTIPRMKKGSQIADLVDVKARLAEAVAPIALRHGFRYTGGHPMAGLAKAGYERSFADPFHGSSMILVPTEATAEGDLETLKNLFLQVGFRRVRICDAKTHNRMIAHTLQLAHIVSNSYVKSPVSPDCVGFSGGSYKDMTRIACLNEMVWKELFLLNRDALLPEIDLLIRHMADSRNAIADTDRLEALLRQGREAKERIDTLNPDQPSE